MGAGHPVWVGAGEEVADCYPHWAHLVGPYVLLCECECACVCVCVRVCVSHHSLIPLSHDVSSDGVAGKINFSR